MDPSFNYLLPPQDLENPVNKDQESEHDEAPEYLGPARVAEILHVSPKTVNRWANEGRIPCIVTLGGHRRFRRADVEQALDQMASQGRSISNP